MDIGMGLPAHLPQHRVAAGHIVLGDLVDGGDPTEVVTNVVAWLHGNDIFKVNQGGLSMTKGSMR
eukprot:459542-Pelagomonas_calceolata.AAC.1